MKTSLPSWERGLKLLEWAASPTYSLVAPFVGAWIETGYVLRRVPDLFSRSLRGSVD